MYVLYIIRKYRSGINPGMLDHIRMAWYVSQKGRKRKEKTTNAKFNMRINLAWKCPKGNIDNEEPIIHIWPNAHILPC